MPTAVAIHHPRPEHVDDWVARMRQAGDASADTPGLTGRIVGYRDDDHRRLVAISHWESMDSLKAGVAALKTKSDQADRTWGEKATDILVLTEI
jgi:heme-degrading monooxygenase HmoA